MIEHNKPTLGKEEIKAIEEVIQSRWIAQGKKVERFEKEFAKWLGVEEAAATSSGTSALHIALIALGVKKGDEVIIPTYVCSALLNAIFYCQARPILVDTNQEDFNISFTETKKKITSRTKAIILPHIFGSPIDVDQFRRFNIPIIEDCAQTLGAKIGEKSVGTIGDLAVHSFYATKLLTTGQGGMITSNNKKIIDKCRDLIDFDCRPTYKIRYNYKMTDMQGAMGIEQLKKINFFLKKREEIAGRYKKKIKAETQKTIFNGKRIYYRYVIKVPANKLKKYIHLLEKKGIKTTCPIKNYELLHNYLGLNKKEFKKAEEISKTTLSLPIYPSLKEKEIKKIIKDVNKVIKS